MRDRGRYRAAQVIGAVAGRFPDLGPVAMELEGLSPPERRLAVAVVRTTLQRWLTLEHLLNRVSKQPTARLEPAMQAVLLTGAAQLLFMPGMASYAVVDESVRIAGKLVRPQARGMVNAVLRKMAAMVDRFDPDEPWTPGRDRLPCDSGPERAEGGAAWGTLHLTAPALPHPANRLKHLPVACSHPESLVARWTKQWGVDEALRLCLHNLQNPPTIVVVEEDFACGGTGSKQKAASEPAWQPHERTGFIVWRGEHAALVDFLAGDRRRRVQDPASFAAAAAGSAAAAQAIQPKVILDYCAGRGTKTRQLALAHPAAQVIATDVNPDRRAALAELPATFSNVCVVEPDDALRQRCDLLVLDVPCSNSGVLARRPEARYRFSDRSLAELVDLQRRIAAQTLPLVRLGGGVLYMTCSLEAQENQEQARWLEARSGGTLIAEAAERPGGRGVSYHDGSYHALVRLLRISHHGEH